MTAPVVSLMQRDITTERDLLISVFSTQDRQKPMSYYLPSLKRKKGRKKERKKKKKKKTNPHT